MNNKIKIISIGQYWILALFTTIGIFFVFMFTSFVPVKTIAEGRYSSNEISSVLQAHYESELEYIVLLNEIHQEINVNEGVIEEIVIIESQKYKEFLNAGCIIYSL